MNDRYNYIVNGKLSYYSIDISDKKYIETFLENNKKRNGVYDHFSILKDVKFYEIIKKIYLIDTIGIKSIVKLLDNKITYTQLRSLLSQYKILKTSNDFLYSIEQKNMRKYNAINKITKTFKDTMSVYDQSYKNKIKNNKLGIQGYYWSKQNNKYVWLRSTYEYAFIDYLENNNIPYEYEYIQYLLIDGRNYRPDFHIYTTNEKKEIDCIVEIKSDYYLSHQDDKLFILQKTIKNKCLILIGFDDIRKYIKTEKTYSEYLSEWKQIKKRGIDVKIT